MKTIGWIAVLAGLVLSTACASRVSKTPIASPPDSPVQVSESPRRASPHTVPNQAFPDLVAPTTDPNRPLPVPLIPPTTVVERLPEINPGRTDPFSAFPTTPQVTASIAPTPDVATNSPQRSVPNPSVSAIVSAPPRPISNSPVSPPRAVPPSAPITVAPAPIVVPPTPLPAVPVPAEPPQSLQPQYPPATIRPDAVAESDQGIQISGVVQIGSTVSAIVQVAGESTRYVNEGDTLANGRIRVHKIEMNGQEPRVILEQDGTQIVRTVGSSASADTF